VYKVLNASNHSQVFCPEKPLDEYLAVSEIGYAAQPAGFDSGIMKRSYTVLQYVLSGRITYNGISVTAPAILFMSPNTNARYIVDGDCHNFSSYWIKCYGSMLDTILSSAGFNLKNEVYPLTDAKKVGDVFSALTNEEEYVNTDDHLFMISGLYRLLSLNTGFMPEKTEKSISSYTNTVLDYIHTNYSANITERLLASTVNLSTNYMHKIFLGDTNTTPINYLNSYRIKCAKKMLHETDLSIAEIAEAVGFSGGDYFCRVFRKYSNGTSPSEYRKKVVLKK